MNGAQLDDMSSTSNGDEILDEERLFDLLGNERRRSCLQCLATAEATVTVQDLASQVATRVSSDECPPDEIRDSVYISLCQNHLPKLDDADVIDYDSDEKIVGSGSAFWMVERHLIADPNDASCRTTTPYYFLASVATVLVLGVAAYGIPVALSYVVPALITLHAVAIVALGRRLL